MVTPELGEQKLPAAPLPDGDEAPRDQALLDLRVGARQRREVAPHARGERAVVRRLRVIALVADDLYAGANAVTASLSVLGNPIGSFAGTSAVAEQTPLVEVVHGEVDRARVTGRGAALMDKAEAEARKRLGILTPALDAVTAFANVTVMRSEININEALAEEEPPTPPPAAGPGAPVVKVEGGAAAPFVRPRRKS